MLYIYIYIYKYGYIYICTGHNNQGLGFGVQITSSTLPQLHTRHACGGGRCRHTLPSRSLAILKGTS